MTAPVSQMWHAAAKPPAPVGASVPPALGPGRLRAVDPRRYVVYLGFALVMVIFAITLRDAGFLTVANLVNIVQQTAPITVMAVGMVLVVTAGEIDLSIGSVVALSALVAGVTLRATENMPLAILAALAVGSVVGLFNGLFATQLRVASFLVTLATMGLVSGLGRSITNLQAVPIVDASFNGVFGSGSVGGISTLVIWSVVAVAVGHFVYRHTRFGAHVLAVGDNARAAQVSGIQVERVKVAVLVISGACAALAGLLYAGRLHGASYTLGEADLMTVIAAVIVGGTRLFGGSGTVVGALVGSLIMGVLNNGLILAGLSVSQQLIARGAIILVAVALTLREEKA